MLTAHDIADMRTAAIDYKETEQIKARMAQLRACDPFELGREDLEAIFHWKLGSQYGRVKRHLDHNSDATCRAVTRAALAVSESDLQLEMLIRMGILTALPGIGVPVASAILALADPEKYCVIDFRGWRALFNQDRRSFDTRDYWQYLQAIKKLAAELQWTPQEVDLAVWEYDRRHN